MKETNAAVANAPESPAREPRGCLPGSLLLRYEDVELALGYERTFVRELIERGRLIRVGKGKATRITAFSVRAYAADLEAAARKERGLGEEEEKKKGAKA